MSIHRLTACCATNRGAASLPGLGVGAVVGLSVCSVTVGLAVGDAVRSMLGGAVGVAVGTGVFTTGGVAPMGSVPLAGQVVLMVSSVT